MTTVGQHLDQALAAKDWQSALTLLKTWTSDRPNDFNGWFWTAYCLEQQNRIDEAYQAVQKACTSDSDDQRGKNLLRQIKNRRSERSQGLMEDSDDGVPATEAGPEFHSPATETGGASQTPEPLSTLSALWRPGEVVNGRYEVREVRRGGMGEVYFVFDRALALDLAVKTPLPKTLATPSGRLRFLREAEAWIGLGLHANICAAYYVQELGGIARLFIELIDGSGLDQWIKSDRAEGFSQRLDMAIQVASGMHHAHTFRWIDEGGNQHQGLAHRDLKPANVLVGSDGIARVTDFGLVGRGFDVEETLQSEADDLPSVTPSTEGIWQTVTLGGGLMGTPPYMPPEQWDGGHAAGKPADFYAFGCILFELFCGRRPFLLSRDDRKARIEVQLSMLENMHRHSPPPLPESLNERIDADLGRLMLQCLEKDPTDRPESFAEIRQRLVEVFGVVTARSYPRPNPEARQLLGDALNNQGMSYATLGQGNRAESAWEEALEIDPHHIEATFNLTLFRWQFRGASNSETLARMEDVLRSDNPPWKAHHLAGKLCLAVGDRSKALDHLEIAHRVSAGMPEVARDYAVALCSQGDSPDQPTNFQETVDVLARCGGPLRFDPILLTTYATAMERLGQPHKSTSLYKEARRHDPSLPEELKQGSRLLIPGGNEIRRLEGFSGRVMKIDFAEDGKRMATVLHGGAICLWDLEEGQIEQMLRPPGDRTRCLAVAPDGKSVLATAEGDPISDWNSETGTIRHRLQAHSGFINALKITNDGRKAVGVGTTGSLNSWDLTSRSLNGSYPVHSGYLTCLALSADCTTAVTGGSGGKILALDINDGEIIARPERHQVEVSCVAISQGGRIASSGDENGDIHIWNLPEGETEQVLKGHRGAIRFLSINETSSHCLSLDSTGSLRLWDLKTGRLLTSIAVAGEGRCAACSPDWNTVVIGHGPAGLTQFDFSTVSQPLLTWAVASPVSVGEANKRARSFAAHLDGARSQLAEGDAISALAEIDLARSIPGYGRIEKALSLAAEAGAAFPRDGLKGGWAEEVLTLHRGKVNCVRVGPSGNSALSVGADRQVLLWNLMDGRALCSIEPTDTPELTATFVSNIDQFATAGLNNVVHLWEIESGNLIRTFEGHQAQVNDLASAGSLILSGSSDGTVRVWDTQTGVCIQVFDGHSREIVAVAFSPDARMCASSGEDELLLWDPVSGRDTMALVGHKETPSAIVWSDDGRNLLSASRDGQLRLWDVSSGNCLRTIEVNQAVLALALSPDNQFALSGNETGAVQLWEIRSRRCLRTFQGHVGPVSSVAFSVDGQRGLSAGDDGSIRLWYLDWHTAPETATGWNDQAKPYLEVFLTRQSTGTEGPQWEEADFRTLLDDLGRRRLGHLSPEEVRRNLERMAAEWTDQSATATVIDRRTRHHRQASTSRRKAARKRLIRKAVVLFALIPLIILVWSTISSGRLRFDSERIHEVRQKALAARFPFAIESAPGTDCDPADFREYLDVFTKETTDYSEIAQAGQCLGQIQDSRAVAPLLALTRPVDPKSPGASDKTPLGNRFDFLPSTREEILSILLAIGDNGCAELKEGLVDEASIVRTLSAKALAYQANEKSISTLLDSAEDREPVVRIAVSQALEAVASSGIVSPRGAFELFARMARDNYPEVRTNVALGLRIFKGSRPRDLLEELAQDLDENVRQAAQRSLLAY